MSTESWGPGFPETVNTVTFTEESGRTVLSVVLGLVATALPAVALDAALCAVHVFPPGDVVPTDAQLLLAATYRVAFAVLGGAVTARVAPTRPWVHAGVLAALGTTLSGLGLAMAWNLPELGPRWYPALLFVTAAPCVAAGAWLSRRSGGLVVGDPVEDRGQVG